jgi:hypothetical protein
MLKTLYGKNVTKREWRLYARQIIECSSRFGYSALRSEAEAWLEKERRAQEAATALAEAQFREHAAATVLAIERIRAANIHAAAAAAAAERSREAAAAAVLAMAATEASSAVKLANVDVADTDEMDMDNEICITGVLSNDEVLSKRLDMAMKKGEVIEIDD